MLTVPRTAWVGSPLGLVSGAMAWYARKTYPLTSTTYRTSRAPGSKSRLTIVHAQTDANSCPCALQALRRQSGGVSGSAPHPDEVGGGRPLREAVLLGEAALV